MASNKQHTRFIYDTRAFSIFLKCMMWFRFGVGGSTSLRCDMEQRELSFIRYGRQTYRIARHAAERVREKATERYSAQLINVGMQRGGQSKRDSHRKLL